MQEQEAKRDVENAGGAEVMKRAGGEKAGLPFFAFLSPDGETIVNSMRPAEGADKGGNIGHPYEPKEVDWFMAMVHKAVPGMTPEESGTLEKWLRSQKK